MKMEVRPRRNRRTAAIRNLVRETSLSVQDLILPLFFHEDEEDVEIESMPGCIRWSVEGLVGEVKSAYEVGVQAVVLFPKIEEGLKTADGKESYCMDGLVPKAIRRIKQECPGVCVITDVALDPYNSDGHDGIVVRAKSGELEILNDETVDVLCKQALCHAEAGADIVAPSDMMDGRVRAIRQALDSGRLPRCIDHGIYCEVCFCLLRAFPWCFGLGAEGGRQENVSDGCWQCP